MPDAPEGPPVPAAILSAKRVFVSNGGLDNTSLAVFKRFGDVTAPYTRFYSALKAWGRFELVNSPSDADMVMEVRFTAPLTEGGKLPTYTPVLQVTLLDAKTHFILWTLGERIDMRGSQRI